MTKLIAGIDVSKHNLNVHVNGQDLEFGNTRTSIRSLAKHLTREGVERVVLEATGRLHRMIPICWGAVAVSVRIRPGLHSGGSQSAPSPRLCSRLYPATGQRAKTDRVDARIRVAFGEAFGEAFPDLSATPHVTEEIDQLRDLLVIREALVKKRADLKLTHAELDLDAEVEANIQMVFTTLDQQVDALATAIQSRVRESHTLATAFSILSSVPGVGLITAASLIAWMGERGSLTHRKSAALIGVAPFAADSGKLKGSRHIRGGRDRPRTVLYMAAFSATFHNPDMIAFYQRLRNGGKPHKVALVAVMRKMIVLINALLRDQRHWENRTPLTGV